MDGMEMQNRINAITHIMQTYGFQGALKAVMSTLKSVLIAGPQDCQTYPFPKKGGEHYMLNWKNMILMK